MNAFSGKVILVTGTSSGMGAATALKLAGEGAQVICAARREDRGRELVERITQAGGNAEFFRTDIADDAAVDALFAHIAFRYGRLDGAFNNAGIEVPHADTPDIPVSAFDLVFAVNVRGTFLCMQHEMRMMRERNSGAIVNVSSLGGVRGLKASTAYVASKHAVVGLTRGAALDGAAYGVRVNALCPGSIDTEMMQRWTQGRAEVVQYLSGLAPMKRVGRAEEIAEAAAWLLSEASSYTTGLIMEIDGGLSVGMGV